MSDNQPNTQATGPESPGTPPIRPDIRALFREYYESLPDIPRGRLENDVVAVEGRYGALVGWDRDELIAIARETRNVLRQERNQLPEPNDRPRPNSSPRWEVWLTRIGFGIFVLAAVGLFYYAISIKKLEPSWENLRPYVIGITGTAILLLLLTFGRTQIEKADAPKWLGQLFVIALVVLFVAAVALVLIWFGILILQDAGVIKAAQPPKPTPVSAPKVLSILPDTTSLPEDLFGQRDHHSKPRQWEKYLLFGFHHELKRPEIVYLVTYPFPAPRYKGFTLHVNVNTMDTVLPLVFLVRSEGDNINLVPLLQADLRQGPRLEYRYTVPDTNRENDRLVVILGMERDTYDRIAQPTKFVLSSEPLLQ